LPVLRSTTKDENDENDFLNQVIRKIMLIMVQTGIPGQPRGVAPAISLYLLCAKSRKKTRVKSIAKSGVLTPLHVVISIIVSILTPV